MAARTVQLDAGAPLRARTVVIATGVSHSVRDLVQVAFDRVGLPWQDYVRLDERMIRPAEVETLKGHAREAYAVGRQEHLARDVSLAPAGKGG